MSTPSDRATRESLIFGALGAVLGGLTGLVVSAIAIGKGYGSVPVSGALAGFVAGAGLWRLMVVPRRTGAYGLALACGAVAVPLAHYLTFCFQFILAWADHALFGGSTDSFGRPPVGPVYGALKGAPVLAAMSLLLAGWITIPLGAVLGLSYRMVVRMRERRRTA